MQAVLDSQYQNLPFNHAEMDHAYGENVHILSTPMLMTLLARVCSPKVVQPEANRIFTELYIALVTAVVNGEFPRSKVEIPSRMIEHNEHGVYRGEVLDPDVRCAVAAVARAGILPSQVVFDRLNLLFHPQGIREDCFFVSRAVDKGQKVVGANVASSKIGGSLADHILLLPDPMGATGSSLVQTLDTYQEAGAGDPKRIVAMHLIVTPEYLKNLKKRYPGVVVYAIRLDRGLSPQDVLETKPGTRWDEERGLNDVHYIVPGGGGIGEVITNSWV